MLEFTPSKKTAKDFNNGIEYIDGQGNETGDALQAETINNLVESALYTQEQVDNANSTAKGALSEVEKVLEDKTLFPVVKKNLYNLGAFDTFVSNGDGTGTVTRKTGLINCADFLKYYCTSSSGNFPSKNFVFWDMPQDFGFFGITENIKTNNKDVDAIEAGIFNKQRYLEIYTKITFNRVSDFLIFIKNSTIEYAVDDSFQYTEQVIENESIHLLDQNMENIAMNEVKKRLNILNPRLDSNDRFTVGRNGKISSEFFDSRIWGYSASNIKIRLFAGTYTIEYFDAVTDQASDSGLSVYDEQNNPIVQLKDLLANRHGQATFSLAEDTNIGIMYKLFNGSFYLMLVKGTFPYAYEPYHGEIIHENRVPLYITDNDTSPVDKFGGTWESLGSNTVGTTTLYYWRQV